jgi:xyloglucan galactosyltransferase MUR3
VVRWQDRVRGTNRAWLMAFIGAPRPDVPINIRVRDHVIEQCKATPACTLLGCARNLGSTQCHTPLNIMRLFQKTVFCLQPPGDSCTRRSVFDSMAAGCIPVFFHPASAYKQYPWHFPQDHLKYSVFIPDADVRQHNVSIEAVLRAIPPETVERMREEVISLIPRLLYADPRAPKLETLKDAFDVTVEGVLDRVARIRNGEEVNSGGPVDEDPPFLFASTDAMFRPQLFKKRVYASPPPVVRRKRKTHVQSRRFSSGPRKM